MGKCEAPGEMIILFYNVDVASVLLTSVTESVLLLLIVFSREASVTQRLVTVSDVVTYALRLRRSSVRLHYAKSCSP